MLRAFFQEWLIVIDNRQLHIDYSSLIINQSIIPHASDNITDWYGLALFYAGIVRQSWETVLDRKMIGWKDYLK